MTRIQTMWGTLSDQVSSTIAKTSTITTCSMNMTLLRSISLNQTLEMRRVSPLRRL